MSTNTAPHILFCGPPCTGKKTALFALLRTYYPLPADMNKHVMIVNCAHNKGIGFVRNEIKYFTQLTVAAAQFKSVVLLNADYLTIDAQSALRRCMEQSSGTTRFFGVANDRNRLIFPILSRFSVVTSASPTPTTPTTPTAPTAPTTPTKVELQPPQDQDQSTSETDARLSDIVGALLRVPSQLELVRAATRIYTAGITAQTLLQWIHTHRPSLHPCVEYTPAEWAACCLTLETERKTFRNDTLFLIRILGMYALRIP